MCNKKRKKRLFVKFSLQKQKNLRKFRRFFFDRGLGRFEEKASFATEGVQRYDESSANGGRKSPLIFGEIRRISTLLTNSFAFLIDISFSIFGLFRFYQI
jgi:hypothetical protein